MSNKTKLVITIEGGVLQNVYVDNPDVEIECIVVDYDTQTFDEDSLKEDIDGNEYVSYNTSLVENTEFVNDIFFHQVRSTS